MKISFMLFVKHRYYIFHKLEEEINKLGGKITKRMKPYEDMNLAQDRMKVLVKSFYGDKMVPILRSVSTFSKLGLQMGHIAVYIICKHIIELYPDLREKEFDRWKEANEKINTDQILAKKNELAFKDYLG